MMEGNQRICWKKHELEVKELRTALILEELRDLEDHLMNWQLAKDEELDEDQYELEEFEA